MPTSNTIITAAGGLIESRDDDVLTIAVIHRDRYDDWTLPKGHIEEGETIEEAAIREVEEETGCRGEIIEIVRPLSYLVKNQPKIVVFYRMALVERGDLKPNDEVSMVKWMKPVDAVGRLTHRIERELIADIYGS